MSKVVTDKEKIRALLDRGVEEVIVREHLEQALLSGRQLRVKIGTDPTAPDLHLGHAVALRKLRQFQELGHQVVLIIGDYTTKIGDPSGRSKTRPALSDVEIAANAKTYLAQAGKVLDIKKTEVRHNSEWFADKKLDFILALESRFTAQRILERDDFSKRIKEGTEVYAHEMVYPMLQAYDSVEVKADIELGGTDQKFNMLAGRDLQRHMGLPEQDVITVPLLVGTDGVHKMSKTLGNYIGLTDEPNIMFGKIMSVPDELIDSYYALCTDAVRSSADPREAKLALGAIIVDMYHGKGEGKKARGEFVRVFSKKEKPEDRLKIKKAGNKTIVESLVIAEIATSKSDARRLVEQGGVRVNDEVIKDPKAIVPLDTTVQVGPRRFYDT
ncbi:MAG: tyrosine--tRNA ligase [Candidatus Harrisonbacteria bacterium]|nr:tyrosine--tRNA ligase [Candidatus Harrisonbacteria bacterium]